MARSSLSEFLLELNFEGDSFASMHFTTNSTAVFEKDDEKWKKIKKYLDCNKSFKYDMLLTLLVCKNNNKHRANRSEMKERMGYRCDLDFCNTW